MSGMPSFHFPGDAEVKRQTVESAIAEGVYHVSELHARAVALHSSAVLLNNRIATQVDALRAQRADYRTLAAAVATLAVIAEVANDSDQDLVTLLAAANAEYPDPEGRPKGTLPLDITQALNGYGGGMILGQLVIKLGQLTKAGLLGFARRLAPEALEELPAALEDLGVALAEPTAEEAVGDVAAAFGEGAMEALSGASVAAAGVGFLITAGVEIGLGWASAEKDAERLQKAIDAYQSNIDKLTTYSRVVTAKYNQTYAATRDAQRRVNSILTALAGVFGPLDPPVPQADPDPTRITETVRVVRRGLRQYGLYAEVRMQWQKWRRNHPDDTGPAFVAWWIDAAREGTTAAQIQACVDILRKNSESFAKAG
ncbi:hypothetical protein ACFVVX_10745 [Kitasatospora sp. NPDC058170]|uniref:hypothetical protein n=1 Tax=Kitasatospora sp. NPDC058170 TaxID=3346364 RepID=UPI0036D9C1E6